MKNLFDEEKNFENELDLRVYTSNILGVNPDLVLHGGGNTSVKLNINGEEILYVKGSGWDLSNIKREGFAPVKMDALLSMAKLDELSDSDMVRMQKEAMIDKKAPNPSVEAILHALIPYKFVDHTHADAIVTITNSKDGEDYIKKLFPNFLIVPYVMPGFILAKTIFNMTKDVKWDDLEGIILLNHGIFTFDDNAKNAYDKMIEAVSKAENFLNEFVPLDIQVIPKDDSFDIENLQKMLSLSKGEKVVLHVNDTDLARFYAWHTNLGHFASRGVLTPEHIIRTKREPLVLKSGDDFQERLNSYMENYQNYFKTFAKDEIMLNSAPKYVVIENFGVICVGKDEKEASIINDIVTHTMKAVLQADKLGGYESITLEESFKMEYWELEQAKLK